MRLQMVTNRAQVVEVLEAAVPVVALVTIELNMYTTNTCRQSSGPARAPPVQRPPPVQATRQPQITHQQPQPTRQPQQQTQPHNNPQSRPPVVGAGQNPWNGNGNGGIRPPTTIQSRPPTAVPSWGQSGNGNSRPPQIIGATPGYGQTGRPYTSTVVGATPRPGPGQWPTNRDPGYNGGAVPTAGPGQWPGQRPPPRGPPATVTVHDPPPHGYNPGGGYGGPAYTSTRFIPYPTPGGGYGYNDPYGYPININLPPINLPPIIIDNPIWTIPFPGCSYAPVTTQSPTAIESAFTSTITQMPEFVTVYVGDDGYQTTYGNDPTTAYEVYMYTTTVYVDVISKTRECWL
jgi:hypothetical protein